MIRESINSQSSSCSVVSIAIIIITLYYFPPTHKMHLVKAVISLFALSSFAVAQIGGDFDAEYGLARREVEDARDGYLAARDEFLIAREEYIEKRGLLKANTPIPLLHLNTLRLSNRLAEKGKVLQGRHSELVRDPSQGWWYEPVRYLPPWF